MNYLKKKLIKEKNIKIKIANWIVLIALTTLFISILYFSIEDRSANKSITKTGISSAISFMSLIVVVSLQFIKFMIRRKERKGVRSGRKEKT